MPNLQPNLSTVFAIAAAGALGVLARYFSGLSVAKLWAGSFPLATFLINLSGSFLIGLVWAWSEKQGSAKAIELRAVLMTGFLGGFTTYSAFSLETIRLLQASEFFTASAYVLASVVGGLACCWVGLNV